MLSKSHEWEGTILSNPCWKPRRLTSTWWTDLKMWTAWNKNDTPALVNHSFRCLFFSDEVFLCVLLFSWSLTNLTYKSWKIKPVHTKIKSTHSHVILNLFFFINGTQKGMWGWLFCQTFYIYSNFEMYISNILKYCCISLVALYIRSSKLILKVKSRHI